jgi:uncharacterized protein (TIGR04255 family)
MSLPVKLNQDLILSAVFDLWFSTKIPSEAVLGMVYQFVAKKYPTVKLVRLPITQLSEEIRNSDPNLKYQPHYRLDIDTRGIAVGPKSIQFSVQKPYIGWKSWSEFIIEMWAEFVNMDIFNKIERTSLRFFNFTEQNLCEIARTSITIGDNILSCQPMTLKVELQEDAYATVLQLVSNAVVEIYQSQRLNGSVIDIEVIKKAGISVADFQGQIGSILNESHDIEKKLFFEILQPEFLETLQPVYQE